MEIYIKSKMRSGIDNDDLMFFYLAMWVVLQFIV